MPKIILEKSHYAQLILVIFDVVFPSLQTLKVSQNTTQIMHKSTQNVLQQQNFICINSLINSQQAQNRKVATKPMLKPY